MLRCKISCLHYMSLSQVLDNHIQRILYMYNISRYILDIGIFLLPVISIGISPQKSHIRLAIVVRKWFAKISFWSFSTTTHNLFYFFPAVGNSSASFVNYSGGDSTLRNGLHLVCKLCGLSILQFGTFEV